MSVEDENLPGASRAGASGIEVFDREAARYDAWFDSAEGRVLFRAEVDAISRVLTGLPGPGLEVGVGTGRFAQALGVFYGVDAARGALRLAQRRGVHVVRARGEALPFPGETFGMVLLIVTLCFAAPRLLLRDARRVLRRPGGGLIVADILRDSLWGHWYLEKQKAGPPFYRHAAFYTLDELRSLLAEAGLVVSATTSAITQPPGGMVVLEEPYVGMHPGASFMCLRAQTA